MKDWKSLSHVRWDCKYHLVFISKYRHRWQKRKNRKPLLLQGARQVGKTYVLQNFGENRFNTSHYFDLEELKTDMALSFLKSFKGNKTNEMYHKHLFDLLNPFIFVPPYFRG